MNSENITPNISPDQLWHAIKKEYANAAIDPHKGYHFHTGREALRIGYDESLYADLSEANIASFAGTGNPFILDPINP